MALLHQRRLPPTACPGVPAVNSFTARLSARLGDQQNLCSLRRLACRNCVLWLPLQVQYVWFMLLYCAYMAVLLAIGSAVNIGFFRKNSYGLQIVSVNIQACTGNMFMLLQKHGHALTDSAAPGCG